jgi:mRNA-degrading endonuclease RelE of RelBE toxin-antitoxin system
LAYNIVYKKSVYRDLKKLSKTDAKRILDRIEMELIKKPESNPVLTRITGTKNMSRAKTPRRRENFLLFVTENQGL